MYLRVASSLILYSVITLVQPFPPVSPRKAAALTSRLQDSMRSEPEENYEVINRNPLRWLVLRLGLTEPAMTSPLNYGEFDGIFSCAYCGKDLFDSNAKYNSGTGWPSFWRTLDGSVQYQPESNALECKCKRCKSHLGHVFLDGPRPATVPSELLSTSPESDPRGTTGRYLPRYCMNGAALRYTPRTDN